MKDDIEEIIKSAQHMKYSEKEELRVNLISSLPDTKPHLKKAIKERIRVLYGAYISLATFIADEDLESFLKSKKVHKQIYEKIFEDMEIARKEMEKFKPFDI
jgi:hypothetical protein